METLVIGAGSLGSLVGGLLAEDHDVTLVGRDPHVSTVLRNGLAIGGKLDGRVHPDAALTADGASADLAIVTVKAGDTPGAAEALAGCDVDVVWSLQNGLDNEATLADALDATVLAGTATYGADLTTPGAVACTGVGEVAIGPRPGSETPEEDAALAEELAAALRGDAADGTAADASAAAGASGGESGEGDDESLPGLAVVADREMPTRLWRKLAVNVAINPTTALARVENGQLAEEPAAATGRQAARETAGVARATGIDLADDDAVAEFEAVVGGTAVNRSSMRQDVESGVETEIDEIAGRVIERAETHDVAVPTVRTLYSLVVAWEQGSYLR